ncbi:glycosyltransferase family 4 protein [Paroceanicella profunda]|nr:glycosyltransferase family 4 protein [Paroceanicella profunda]
MPSFDPNIYWQSYPDMLELHALGHWTDAEFTGHWENFGRHEGRRVADEADVPVDWSDWLYFSEWRDEFGWWWRQGALGSMVWSALVSGDNGLEFGRISRNERVRELTGLSPEALRQIAEHGRAFPGRGPLSQLRNEPLPWSTDAGVVLPIEEQVTDRFPSGADVVIILPSLRVGGAELVGAWHAHLARRAGLSVAILLADKSGVSPVHEPLRDAIVDLPELCEAATGRGWTDLTVETRTEVVTHAVAALRPQVMHLCHSWIGYTALATPHLARRLRASAATIHVSAFCHHVHATGNYDGYFRYIPEIVEWVDRFIFDNEWYCAEIRERYGLPEERTVALKYPVAELPSPAAMAAAAANPRASNTVLWASRLDHQKNPQVVGRIAAEMPDLDFVIYGSEILYDTRVDWAAMPQNLRYGGPFSSVDELPTDEAFAFLYTARFDGTPNILLEMGARGVPVVAPKICGIPDFLGPDWPFYVPDCDDVPAYVAALRRLHEDPSERAKASARLLAILRAERSFDSFADAGMTLLDCDPGRKSA